MERLKVIERRLRRGEPLSARDSLWLANAFFGHTRRGLSIERLLGLVASRGKVRKKRELAIKIADYRLAGLGSKAIGEKLGLTAKAVKKIAPRYGDDVAAHKAQRIADAANRRLNEKLRRRHAAQIRLANTRNERGPDWRAFTGKAREPRRGWGCPQILK
jgi:hypothetical protein